MSMGVTRTITFGKDSVYYVIQNRGIYILPPIYKGAYQVKGNRLITRFSADNFGRISVIPYEFSPVPGNAGMYEMFANGTFRVVDGRLIIQHTGYYNRKPEPTITIYRLNPRD